jgi:hypothetical protein
MARFARAEVEAAFAEFWKKGCVDEDWAGWANLFTEDAVYHDHFWGPLYGRREIAVWIDAVMAGVPEIYNVLDWYTIEDATVVWHCQNRRDNPSDEGPAYWDFPGLSVASYAGDGLWTAEEDFWDRDGARRTSVAYAAACERAGAHDVMSRLTRRHWAAQPDWARTDAAPHTSWVDRRDVQPITRPSQLAQLLAPLRA